MSDYGEYGAPTGSCFDCGRPTAEAHHRRCPSCYAAQQRRPRPARPAPGTPPESFIVGLAQLRERLAALERATEAAFRDVERRLAQLERIESGRAA